MLFMAQEAAIVSFVGAATNSGDSVAGMVSQLSRGKQYDRSTVAVGNVPYWETDSAFPALDAGFREPVTSNPVPVYDGFIYSIQKS
jgi:hypothetical protein